MFNVCIDESIYPDVFKWSKISAVSDKGNRTYVEPHRLISVLCNLSKTSDSILQERITNHFTRDGLLSAGQFGYREAENTELAALRLIDRILPAFQAWSYSICVFLYLRACFDTISRDILFNKPVRYGVHGSSLMFVKSYFNNRCQFVTFRGASSTIHQQEIGTKFRTLSWAAHRSLIINSKGMFVLGLRDNSQGRLFSSWLFAIQSPIWATG